MPRVLSMLHTVENRPRNVSNPYIFLLFFPFVLIFTAQQFQRSVPPANVDGWKLNHVLVARECMLPPSWGGEKLGGKENARYFDLRIGNVSTVVQLLYTWNVTEQALNTHVVCLIGHKMMVLLRVLRGGVALPMQT